LRDVENAILHVLAAL